MAEGDSGLDWPRYVVFRVCGKMELQSLPIIAWTNEENVTSASQYVKIFQFIMYARRNVKQVERVTLHTHPWSHLRDNRTPDWFWKALTQLCDHLTGLQWLSALLHGRLITGMATAI